MIDFQDKELFLDNTMNKEVMISFPLDDMDPITSSNILSESMEMTQAICDSPGMVFGGCISSEFSIDIFNTASRSFDGSLKGKWIAVRLTLTTARAVYPSSTLFPSSDLFPGKGAESILIFAGKIDEVKSDWNNKNIKRIVAYDLMKDLLEEDCTNKINRCYSFAQNSYSLGTLLNVMIEDLNSDVSASDINARHTPVPCRFGKYFDMRYSGAKTLSDRNVYNENWDFERDNPTTGSIIRYICEIAGLFCVIKPTDTAQYGYLGTVAFISLGRGEYLSGNSFPDEQIEIYESYENLYEEDDGQVGNYTSVMFRGYTGNENLKHGYAIPEADEQYPTKRYDFSNNPLIWDTTSSGTDSDLIAHAQSSTSGIRDRFPRSVMAIELTAPGRPWVEVGDKIQIKVKRTEPDGQYALDGDGNIIIDTITTYVFQKRTSGILGLSDTITVRGE